VSHWKHWVAGTFLTALLTSAVASKNTQVPPPLPASESNSGDNAATPPPPASQNKPLDDAARVREASAEKAALREKIRRIEFWIQRHPGDPQVDEARTAVKTLFEREEAIDDRPGGHQPAAHRDATNP
jgi:hypothetical protein